MNCQELQRDIENLKEAKAAFDRQCEAIINTGKAGPKFHESLEQFDATEDAILEKYLEDFAEHNPECSPYDTGKVSRVGVVGSTEACMIDDTHLLFGGATGEMSIVEIQDDFSLKKIDAKIPEADSGVYGLSIIDENTIVYGSRKTFNDPTEMVFLSKTADGLAESSRISIDGLGDAMISTALSDDRIIIGGGGGLTCVLTRHPDGSIKQSSIIMPPDEARGDVPERFFQISENTAIYVSRSGRVVTIDGLNTDHPEADLVGLASAFVIPLDGGLFLSKLNPPFHGVRVFNSTGSVLSSEIDWPHEISDVMGQLSDDTIVGRDRTGKTHIIRWNGSSFELGEQLDIPKDDFIRPIPGTDSAFFSDWIDGKEYVTLLARKKPTVEALKDGLGLIAKKRQNS